MTALSTGRRPARRRGGSAPFVLVAPAVVLLVTFLLVPIGYTVYLSLRAARVTGGGFGRRVEQFVGLENYRGVLTDSAYLDGVVRMLGYGAVVVPVMLGLALLFALLLDTPRVRLARTTRIGIFLPYAVPGVIASLLWGFLYLPGLSPIRSVLTSVNLPAPDFLGPSTVFFSVANIGVWGGVGFNMIVLFTALRGIPGEMYDAARVDGASEIQIALRVKIPLITPALVMTAIFSIIATLQVFSEPATLQPMSDSIPSTWVPLMTIYRDAFVNSDIHTAAAASVVLALGTLALSIGVLTLLQRRAFRSDQ
ncbi:ABC transporter permease [Asanoa ishikariensis]|uniref:Carbohydrate ABC transporter membrane protein 1, CUT1 family n=1 Tax=Asanoa ishikariensis TaxID=137265 RepID=A0A1H3URF6_9ACTN|nr:sugar ABC transporter permease [Asanoa ishikariensis]GIF69163.1 ABC transporter permease [Asanoa ishikariensis]SDZ64349.1 carbohydrate ABC transporter membrane protein 1, CUT1 family [Asanoa ishikariensis]